MSRQLISGHDGSGHDGSGHDGSEYGGVTPRPRQPSAETTSGIESDH